MAKFKLALSGFRADTDTNPDHFSVYYDSDDTDNPILIKEKTRGSTTISAGTSATITHSLGYVPLVYAFMQIDPNTWVLLGGDSDSINGFIEVNTTNLILHNTDLSNAHAFKYFIFYDQVI